MSDQPRKIRKSQQNTGAQSSSAPKRRRRKKRSPIWLPLIIVLVLIGGAGVYAWNYVNGIMQQVAPDSKAPSIASEVKTAEEYQGDVVGFLLVGIDLTGEGEDIVAATESSNDGLTDMIMYVQFDVKNGKMNMLQIPRNTYVGLEYTCDNTTGNTYKSFNGQINAVARSNKEDGVGNIAALADTIANNYGLPVDYYASIEMAAFKELVDRFGGIEVYIPQDISHKGSVLKKGYQTLNGDAAEFLVRNRKTYADSDLGRLDMQRYVYAGLFNRVRTLTVADVIKLMPVITYYVKTSCDLNTLIELAIAFLNLDSADILVCQAPVFNGTQRLPVNSNPDNDQSVVVANAAGIADLLETYFSEYQDEPITEESLDLADWPHNGMSSDPNVQYMGQLDTEADQAIENGNVLD